MLFEHTWNWIHLEVAVLSGAGIGCIGAQVSGSGCKRKLLRPAHEMEVRIYIYMYIYIHICIYIYIYI